MSTRSLIGATRPDGSVLAIYCHFDGYPEHNGRILARHYTDAAKVEALIALGDLSSLGPEIGEKHPFNERPDGVCTAYGRDRGETGTEARSYSSEIAFALALASGDSAAAYGYLFRNGEWAVLDECVGWRSVAEVVSILVDDAEVSQ